MERRTVPELWREAVRDAPAGPAYLEETADEWRPVTRDEAAERVSALAQGLLARGVRHGDRVAVLSRTRLEWILLDWAVMAIGAVVVGLYPTSSAKECEYILDHCEAVLAFTEDWLVAAGLLCCTQNQGRGHSSTDPANEATTR